jgi:Mg/Co/Ni transporter MgtE
VGCVHAQRLLREAPFELVAGVVDTELSRLAPSASLGEVTRYFAAYNLVAGPVVDAEDHLLGAVTVDDVLDHLLPADWRDRFTEDDEQRSEEVDGVITDSADPSGAGPGGVADA